MQNHSAGLCPTFKGGRKSVPGGKKGKMGGVLSDGSDAVIGNGKGGGIGELAQFPVNIRKKRGSQIPSLGVAEDGS